jgi:CRP-like cAMP-binding protein
MLAPEINFADLFRKSDNTINLSPGTVLFKEGDEAKEGMYIIVEGELDIVIGGKTVDTVQGGTILGEMALLNDKPRSATAIAKTASKVVPVDERRFIFMLQQTPYFALQVMRVLSSRLRNMDHKHA